LIIKTYRITIAFKLGIASYTQKMVRYKFAPFFYTFKDLNLKIIMIKKKLTFQL